MCRSTESSRNNSEESPNPNPEPNPNPNPEPNPNPNPELTSEFGVVGMRLCFSTPYANFIAACSIAPLSTPPGITVHVDTMCLLGPLIIGEVHVSRANPGVPPYTLQELRNLLERRFLTVFIVRPIQAHQGDEEN